MTENQACEKNAKIKTQQAQKSFPIILIKARYEKSSRLRKSRLVSALDSTFAAKLLALIRTRSAFFNSFCQMTLSARMSNFVEE